MTVRRLLVGLLVLALPSVLLVGTWDSADESNTTLAPRTADAAPVAETPAKPHPEFPDADLQAGLEAICSDDAPDLSEKAPAQTYEQLRQTATEHLAVSSSAEHLLAAALLAQNDSASQIDLIKRAVSAGPADPFVLWSAVRICADSPSSPDCPLREWEQRLIAVDGENSEAWMRLASTRYAAGEVNAALEAMRFASTAAESKIYWPETIELIERALRAAGDFDFYQRVTLALGAAASGLPRSYGLTTMCKEQSPENSDWAYVCLSYGELVERQGRTDIGVSIARSVQRLTLEAMGEPEKAAEVEQRNEARRQEQLQKSYEGTVPPLIMTSPNLFYAYIAAVKSVGELDARGHIAADIERLVEQRPNLACR